MPLLLGARRGPALYRAANANPRGNRSQRIGEVLRRLSSRTGAFGCAAPRGSQEMDPRALGRAECLRPGGSRVARRMNLAEALVIKRGNLFLLTPRDGRLPGGPEQPLGLWYRDCRFLSVHELLLDGTPPMLLQASDAHGQRAVHELSDASGGVSVRIVRTLEDPDRLRERVALHSHGERDVRVELSLRLAADFESMLAVRGLVQRRDRYVAATLEGRVLRFAVRGRDDVLRTTTVDLSQAPASCERSGGEALLRFPVELPAGGACEVE